jgi:hypothetical protein
VGHSELVTQEVVVIFREVSTELQVLFIDFPLVAQVDVIMAGQIVEDLFDSAFNWADSFQVHL